MPQLNKGGKFVFGKSVIHEDLTIQLPDQAISEYDITADGKVYLFTGSRITGGFCVTRHGLFAPSKLGHILSDMPRLRDYAEQEGTFLKYKGRSYCWLSISESGMIRLTDDMMVFLGLEVGMELLSIRSSDIAFTMGAKGPLLEKADTYIGEIAVY